jgi:hypothetical protein
MFISSTEARQAEADARKQRLGFAHLLTVDYMKVTSPGATMHVRRLMRAAADKSADYDELLREQETQRLFNVGVLYFARITDTSVV